MSIINYQLSIVNYQLNSYLCTINNHFLFNNMKALYLIALAFLSQYVFAQNNTIHVSEAQEPMKTGQFEPTWESLRSGYQVPEWFRNAKFGIWAHWGPQCVEGSGDWMARELYMEGSKAYKWHREHYGHPSEVGFKDILPLFRAEKWNPDSLVAYYKSLGARYFFVLGNHHDNYDLWDSKYQPWNSKNIGPKRDILREWADAAKKHGLPLGISFHADHSWTWYEPSRRYDLSGKMMGVPYDGVLTKEDGKGKWWEGLDPQQLYQQQHPLSRGSWANGMLHNQWDWSHGADIPSEEFCTNFYNRTLDAINRYSPDLLYFDATVLPLYPISDAGLKIAAHFYNQNTAVHTGKNQAVIFGKILNDEQREAIVWDVERGAPNQIVDRPWQSCSCIGGWHYNTEIYEQGRYKSASNIVKLLVDIVSKNGNLLLNVPLRADGTFDEKEHAILEEFGAWMRQNSEAIYDTRPWIRFGEGPIANSTIKINNQGFNEGSYSKADSREIRFTQKGKTLYAIALAWPTDQQLVIQSLGKSQQRIHSVQLLGYGKVKFQQTDDALTVTLPSKQTNTIAPVLKIK